jgi:boron transporter
MIVARDDALVNVVINSLGIPYFPFMCWVGIWSMIMRFTITIFNGVIFLKYFARFSCDVFRFYICAIYIEKGIQVRSSP